MAEGRDGLPVLQHDTKDTCVALSIQGFRQKPRGLLAIKGNTFGRVGSKSVSHISYHSSWQPEWLSEAQRCKLMRRHSSAIITWWKAEVIPSWFTDWWVYPCDPLPYAQLLRAASAVCPSVWDARIHKLELPFEQTPKVLSEMLYTENEPFPPVIPCSLLCLVSICFPHVHHIRTSEVTGLQFYPVSLVSYTT